MGPAERLVSAASELMYEQGYEAAGVQQLCDRAGVRKGSFYHWFPSKAALAVAMLDENWQRTRLHLFEPAFRADIPPLARFDRYATLLVANHRDGQARRGVMHGCRFGNFAAELSTRDPAVRAKVADVFAAMSSFFAAAIVDAIAFGEVPATDPGPGALAVLAHMEGLVLLAKAANEPDMIGRFGADVRALLGASSRTAGVLAVDHEGAHP